MRLLGLALCAMGLAACYKTPTPDCAFACDVGASAVCPEGYTCRPDGLCKRSGVADDFACPDIADAAAIDSPAIDAPMVDAVDAPMVDAVDAPMVDAVDAMAIDAPDAPPDAAPAVLSITTTAPVDFGMQAVSTTDTRTITVHNSGMTASSAIALDFSVAASQFALVPGATDLCSGQLLGGGSDCTFQVSFTPDTADPFTATVRASATMGGAPTIVVMGTGQ